MTPRRPRRPSVPRPPLERRQLGAIVLGRAPLTDDEIAADDAWCAYDDAMDDYRRARELARKVTS